MTFLETLGVAILGGLVSSILPIYIKFNKSKQTMIDQNRWELKRKACLNALNIANAVLSNYKYENLDLEIEKEKVEVKEIRQCMNELACVCENQEVFDILKNILMGQVKPSIILELRTAVRKELDFDQKPIDSDEERAFYRKRPWVD
jgi:hypothetical protein